MMHGQTKIKSMYIFIVNIPTKQSCVGHDCLGTHLHRIGIRPRTLLHAMQHPLSHGQKPSRTMYRII